MSREQDIPARRNAMIKKVLSNVLVGDSCWEWIGRKDRKGYGVFDAPRGLGEQDHQLAHRFMYRLAFGFIPNNQPLDHLCHDHISCIGGNECKHRACVNPAHLKPTTIRENVLRGGGLTAEFARRTHCKNGHELIGENIYGKRGKRECRRCRALSAQRYRERLHVTS